MTENEEAVKRSSRLSRFRRLAIVASILGGAVGVGTTAGLFAPGLAGASTTCTGNTTTPCAITGTLTLTGGTLAFTTPQTLSWAGNAGSAQSLVDMNSADQQITVNDATGTGDGWHLTVSATTFTTTVGSHTLADTGTFSLAGSTSSATSTSAPAATCVVANACTLPTNSTTFPVAITTAPSTPTAVNIYDTAVNTGLGNIQLANLGWWLAIPATAYAGSYTSTITVSIASGP